MSLLLATPVRAAELDAAHVSLGYSNFRVQLARDMPDSKELVGAVTFSTDVVRGRNRLAGIMLTSKDFADVTHVLWCDDDQWPEDIRIVREMMALDRPIIGAPYTNKREPLRWVHRVDGTGTLAGLGFGFTMTSRKCLETVAEAAEWYVDMPNAQKVPNVFGQLMDEVGGQKTLLSEDYSFCKRARACGFSIELYGKAGIIHHAGAHVWNARQMKGGVVG